MDMEILKRVTEGLVYTKFNCVKRFEWRVSKTKTNDFYFFVADFDMEKIKDSDFHSLRYDIGIYLRHILKMIDVDNRVQFGWVSIMK